MYYYLYIPDSAVMLDPETAVQFPIQSYLITQQSSHKPIVSATTAIFSMPYNSKHL